MKKDLVLDPRKTSLEILLASLNEPEGVHDFLVLIDAMSAGDAGIPSTILYVESTFALRWN